MKMLQTFYSYSYFKKNWANSVRNWCRNILVVWIFEGERQVWNLAPFTIKDFAIRGLADRVKDLNSLVTLYPDIPKDTAFSRYYSPPTTGLF